MKNKIIITLTTSMVVSTALLMLTWVNYSKEKETHQNDLKLLLKTVQQRDSCENELRSLNLKYEKTKKDFADFRTYFVQYTEEKSSYLEREQVKDLLKELELCYMTKNFEFEEHRKTRPMELFDISKFLKNRQEILEKIEINMAKIRDARYKNYSELRVRVLREIEQKMKFYNQENILN